MPMADSQVEAVKQRTDIVALIDERVKLTKAGRNFKALCPFHSEKTASFFVSPELQLFKCFGCGEGGDALAFIQKYEGLTFPEALELLAKKAGVELTSAYRTGEDSARERWLSLLHLVQEYYHFLLTEHAVGKEARKYLQERGVSDSLITMFGLGYAPSGWDNLLRYLTGKKGFTPQELVAVGLVVRRRTERGYYDRFRGRVMFPLADLRGRVMGFSGRVLPGGDEQVAKYINSPETGLYHKKELLYGMAQARQAIRRKDRVVVVEGELDVISSVRAGVTETVAIKGTALTREQILLIRRLTRNVVLALDVDPAGDAATRRSITLAEEAGLSISVVDFSPFKDPDDVVRADPKRWLTLARSPRGVYDFLLDRAFRRYDATSGEGKREISRQLVPILTGIGNAIEREHYVKELASRLEVSERVVAEEMWKAERMGQAVSSQEEGPASNTASLSRRQRLERSIGGLVLALHDGFSQGVGHFLADDFEDRGLRRLWRALLTITSETPGIAVREVVGRLPLEQQRLVETLFTDEVVALTDDEAVWRALTMAQCELARLVARERLAQVGADLADLQAKKQLTPDERRKLAELQGEFGKLSAQMVAE